MNDVWQFLVLLSLSPIYYENETIIFLGCERKRKGKGKKGDIIIIIKGKESPH